jgi:hypothetical protein
MTLLCKSLFMRNPENWKWDSLVQGKSGRIFEGCCVSKGAVLVVVLVVMVVAAVAVVVVNLCLQFNSRCYRFITNLKENW